jgi:hypothetical protein
MPMPVVPDQFEVGKKIVHKPTKATFSFDVGNTSFKNFYWAGVGEQPSTDRDYRKEDVMRVAQQILDKASLML